MAEFDLQGFKSAKKEFDLQGFKASKNPDVPVPSTHRRVDDFEGHTGQAAINAKSASPAAAAVATPDKMSPWNAAGRGFRQMTTAGFADEIDASLNPIVQFMADRAPTAGNLLGIAAPEETGHTVDKGVQDTLTHERQENDRAWDEQPLAYAGGGTAGALASAAAGGAAVKGLGIGSKIAGKTLLGGLLGGANGAGHSEAEDMAGVGKDAAVGAGIGALTGGVAGTTGAILSNPLVRSLATKGLTVVGAASLWKLLAGGK